MPKATAATEHTCSGARHRYPISCTAINGIESSITSSQHVSHRALNLQRWNRIASVQASPRTTEAKVGLR
ncbi:hypothetical protein RBSWK_05092 [Rhodopirellula baltica SWK14]|uniref:Uncharacterized protein n=1 Tax=Rhodopirellula baltica SWK14 TaxID=993516 RepID=L7CD27_RHOBT|nr:hypothetical protein RBSWK_05092 [Rhodopirellula baltica SWK14]